MEISNIPPNREIAAAIRERIKVGNAQINANARIINAKARAWILAGFGAMVAASAIGIGVGAAAAFYAYGYASANWMPSQRAAAPASYGNKPPAEPSPPPWRQMDPQAGRSPGGTQPLGDGSSSSPAGATRDPLPAQGVTSKYTVFKSVKLGSGQITTGWDFDAGELMPNKQYCYYQTGYKSGTDLVTTLARNGQILQNVQTPDGTDVAKAAGNCVWFDSASGDRKQP